MFSKRSSHQAADAKMRALTLTAAVALAGCSKSSEWDISITQGPALKPDVVKASAQRLQADLEKQGHAVVSSVPEGATQLFVVVRYVHKPTGVQFPDPDGAGTKLLEQLSSSAASALGIALKSLAQKEVFADGMTTDGASYFNQFSRLEGKRRDPARIKEELAKFNTLQEQVTSSQEMGAADKQRALDMLKKAAQEWELLKAWVADFYDESRMSPLHAVAISSGCTALVSENSALNSLVLRETLAGTDSPNTAASSYRALTLTELIKECAAIALSSSTSDEATFGDVKLAKSQNAREDWIIAAGTNNRPVSVVLMGAGHRFNDNLARLGLSNRVALIEVTPSKLVQIAKK